MSGGYFVPGESEKDGANRGVRRVQVMISKITEQVRRFFGVLPVSYELSGESILTRSGSSVRELVRVTHIQSWRIVPSDARAVSIRLRDGDTSIVVGDHRGALRELLQRVAGGRRVTT